jgi:hypothetical protein
MSEKAPSNYTIPKIKPTETVSKNPETEDLDMTCDNIPGQHPGTPTIQNDEDPLGIPFNSPTISEIMNVMGAPSAISTPPTPCMNTPPLDSPATPVLDELGELSPQALVVIRDITENDALSEDTIEVIKDITTNTDMSTETATLCSKLLEAMDSAMAGNKITSEQISEVLISNIDAALEANIPTVHAQREDMISNDQADCTEPTDRTTTTLTPNIDIAEDLRISSDEEDIINTSPTHNTTQVKRFCTLTKLKPKKRRKILKLRTLAAIAIGPSKDMIQFAQTEQTGPSTNEPGTTKILARTARQQGGEHNLPNILELNVPLIKPYQEDTTGKRYIVAPRETRFLTHSWYHVGGQGTITAVSELEVDGISSSNSSRSASPERQSSYDNSTNSSDSETETKTTEDKSTITEQKTYTNSGSQSLVTVVNATTSTDTVETSNREMNTDMTKQAEVGTDPHLCWF